MSKSTTKRTQDETIKNESATQRRANRRKNRGGNDVADWGNVDPSLVIKLIETVTNEKGTITFGYTRDGGAYYVNYYVDGIAEKVYCRASEGIDTFLEFEIEAWK